MGAKKLQENLIPLDLPYYYGTESECFQFFKLPKVLFTHPKLKGISNDCKLLYSFMLDRVALSVQNNWRDEDGRVYIIYTNEEASALLGKTPRSITTMMQKMDSEEGKGLIERKKRGQGKCDLIYVKNLISLLEEVEENPKKTAETTSETPQNGEKFSTILPVLPVENLGSVQGLTVQNGNSCVPRVENFSGQEPKILTAIKTDITNTDQNKTDFIKPTFPPNPQPTFPQSPPKAETSWEEGWKDLDKEEKISIIDYEIDKAFQRGKEDLTSLLYHYRTDKSQMEIALYILTGMEESEYQAKHNEEYTTRNLFFCTKKVYFVALLQMLTTNELMNLKGACVSYSKVLEKLVEFITCESVYGDIKINSIMDCTIQAYIKSNKVTEIGEPVAYMKSCIWSTMNEGTIRIEADFHRMFG